VTAPERARADIRAGAERAMSMVGLVKPYRLEKPYRMVTRWHKEQHAMRDARRPGARLIDPFTVEVVVEALQDESATLKSRTIDYYGAGTTTSRFHLGYDSLRKITGGKNGSSGSLG
jgi:D-aminopeptidase